MTTSDKTKPRWDHVARRWWSSLKDTPEDGKPNRGRDRAALARLRRAATPMQALEEPVVFDLYNRLGFGKDDGDVRHWLPRVATVAAVLAHVKEDAKPAESGFRRRFAEMLGKSAKPGDDRPLMSGLRFKRLLATTEDQDVMIAFRRAVALAGARNIDVGDVAASILDWSDRRRMRWAFDYYGAGIAAPKQIDIASTDDED
jgi:CRISPR system Cascade subunit CasB